VSVTIITNHDTNQHICHTQAALPQQPSYSMLHPPKKSSSLFHSLVTQCPTKEQYKVLPNKENENLKHVQ
jgi:hypothetical protein